MKYKVTVDTDEGFVRVTAYESITGNLERAFAEEAIAVAKQSGVVCYLVDVRGMPNIANPSDQYRLSYEDMRTFGLAKTSRIAILVGADDRSHNFIETVFRNAGYDCRLFVNEDDAQNWLRQ